MTLQYELLLVASRFETALLFTLDVSQGVKKHHRNQLPLKCRHCDWNLKACPPVNVAQRIPFSWRVFQLALIAANRQ
jgi:hypothetical protein